MARILLIEPDKQLASLYCQALEHAGHSVDQALAIERAVTMLDTEKYDLLILELQIAKHNGIELLYELRSYADWDGVRVIIQSAVPEHFMTPNQTVQQLRIDHYLYKPKTSLLALCATVQSVLDRQYA